MKVALVHEWLTTLGGSERVLMAFRRMFPEADVFVGLRAPMNLPPELAEVPVRTTFLQNIPGIGRHYRKLLPLMPHAFEALDLDGYDLVISSSHACAKGILTSPETLHVSYCHTPMRYAWDLRTEYLASLPAAVRPLAGALLSQVRQWDVLASQRVDRFVANSRTVAARIAKYYRREAALIHPPVETDRFAPVSPREIGDHFLVVSRLVPYKRVDLAIAAFNRSGKPLRVVGDGPLYKELKTRAGRNITFTGALTDAEVARELARCQALVFPALEDFGIVPLEAQAAGRPVIAFGRGGALETVIDGVTGLFFPEATPESLLSALQRFDADRYAPEAIRRHAASFGADRFAEELGAFLEEAIARHRELPETRPDLVVAHG